MLFTPVVAVKRYVIAMQSIPFIISTTASIVPAVTVILPTFTYVSLSINTKDKANTIKNGSAAQVWLTTSLKKYSILT